MLTTNNGSFPWKSAGTAAAADGAVLDRITREVIETQARAGLDLVTDGLVRQQDPASYVAGRLEGVTLGGARDGFPGSGATYRMPIIGTEIAWRRPILSEDYLFAREGSSRPVKPVLVGPYTLARVSEDRAYNDPMALAMALAMAMAMAMAMYHHRSTMRRGLITRRHRSTTRQEWSTMAIARGITAGTITIRTDHQHSYLPV